MWHESFLTTTCEQTFVASTAKCMYLVVSDAKHACLGSKHRKTCYLRGNRGETCSLVYIHGKTRENMNTPNILSNDHVVSFLRMLLATS